MAKTFAANTAPSGSKFKFGVEVPVGTVHALKLDAENGNTAWRDAIETEIKQINQFQTFRLPRASDDLSEYQRIPYHFVFDVKFDGRRKARLVAGGNVTDPLKEDIYSGVTGLESVRLAFLLAAQNDLQVCAADIGNAFLNGRTREKIVIKLKREFGPELAGKDVIIDRSLYGLRSSAARFHEHLSTRLKTMGFLPSKADPDLWMKDCGDHYEYITRWVDDVLVYGKDPMAVLQELRRDYVLKGVGIPEYYLGGDLVELDNSWKSTGIKTALSAKTYIRNVVEKYEKLFNETFKSQKSPMNHLYHPELDETPFLDQKGVSIFRGLVGSANWMITLGRFDVQYATGANARFSAFP